MPDLRNLKLVIIMVGLPARGKTFLSLRLERYLDWQGYKVKIFNVGSYRRNILGAESSSSDFFDPDKKEFTKERENISKLCFNDLVSWIKDGGNIGIYDATNVTLSRRKYLIKECEKNNLGYVFVENICDKRKILDDIIDIKIKNSPDYKNKDIDWAKKDFEERMIHYGKVYSPLDGETSYIKVFNFGEKIEKNFSGGTSTESILTEITEFLGSIRLVKKNVYLVRHGETFFNLEDRVGGDSSLTENGIKNAQKLENFFHDKDVVIYTSEKIRTIQTADFFSQPKFAFAELNEINSGICDSMSYQEISVKYPEINSARKDDKFKFCYPKGESYKDLIQRVKKVVVAIEKQDKDVLVVAHRAVNRCLLSYFIPTDKRDIPYIDFPLNKVFKIFQEKGVYGCEVLDVA